MPEFFGRPRQSRLGEILAQMEQNKYGGIGRGIETASSAIGDALAKIGLRNQAQSQNRDSLMATLAERGLLGQGGATGTVVNGQKVWDQGVPLREVFPSSGFAQDSGMFVRTNPQEESMSALDVLKTGRFQPKGEIPSGTRITADNFSKYFELVPQTFVDEKGRVITTAPAGAKQISKPATDAADKKEDKKAEKEKTDLQAAYKLYETARSGLVTGLSGSATGPIVGRLPSFTAAQQVAEGGVAAMAPVLKQLFRVSGEGVFTDRDQALLLDMVPTRKDRPEAAKAKMENIDKIVRAKLRIQESSGADIQTGSAPKGWKVKR